MIRGMTEQLLVATIDTALMAQNVAVAAESVGLGLCYVGGIRNHPEAVADLLKLPEHVYPVFGMSLGYPAQNPEVKPRLPLAAILKDDHYDDSDAPAASMPPARRAGSGGRGGHGQSAGGQHGGWGEVPYGDVVSMGGQLWYEAC